MMIYPIELTWDSIRLYLFVLFFLGAGIFHFTNVDYHLSTIPFMPFPKLVVYASGVIELAIAVLLVFDDFRMLTAWGAAIFLVAIFPANIYTAIKPDEVPGVSKQQAYIRLPFQILFVVWVLSLANI